MTVKNSEIIRKVVNYNYKDEVTEVSEKLRKKIQKLGKDKTLYLNIEFNGEVLGKDDEEIINIMAERLIKHKITEKAFERLMIEGFIKPVQMCDDTCSIIKNFMKIDGTRIGGKLGFRRIIYDQFITL